MKRTHNKKLKIATFHCAFVYSGGGERIVIEEVLGLRKLGHKVDLFAPAINEEKCYPELLKKAKPKSLFPQLPKEFPLRDALAMGYNSLFIWLLAPFFGKYDCFIGANQPGAWFAFVLAKLLRKPYIVYLNQPNRMIYPRSIDRETGWPTNKNFLILQKLIGISKPLVSWLDRVSVQNASYLLANGKYIGEVIAQIYGKDFIDCPAGADPFQLENFKIEKKTYYQGPAQVNGYQLQKPYILLTNRHYPQKKFEYAIEALKTIVKETEANLVITGAFTDYTRMLLELVKKYRLNDKVTFLGEVKEKDLPYLYQQSAAYVYTSPAEDYGMGVIEAQYAGVPVVAWNHAGPTVTIVDGKTGFLAKPYEVADFAEKVRFLLVNPQTRVKMGQMAQEHVTNNFTWESHIAILEKAILTTTND